MNIQSPQFSLLNQAQDKNNLNYSIFRCPDPVATKTGEPWYPISNVCPCDPQLSNESGRGFTACPMGLSVEKGVNAPVVPQGQLAGQQPQSQQVVGSLFNQRQAVPPQMWPRQLSRIGNQWRSAN